MKKGKVNLLQQLWNTVYNEGVGLQTPYAAEPLSQLSIGPSPLCRYLKGWAWPEAPAKGALASQSVPCSLSQLSLH